MSGKAPEAAPGDYDTAPARFRTGSESARKYGQGDVHEEVAARVAREGLAPVLDLGCGEGCLAKALERPELRVFGLDIARPDVLRGTDLAGDALRPPLRGGFPVVVAVNLLRHVWREVASAGPRVPLARLATVLARVNAATMSSRATFS